MSGSPAPEPRPASPAGPGGADAPIGVFDSSLGGLTVARAILDQLPHEPILYLGDTARAPYGPRPIAQVRRYALGCLDELVERGVKMLVIACNSASAAVLGDARERYSVPVVEVIRPAVRRAVRSTRNGRVGVLCTSATATSGAYDDAFAANPDLEVVTRAAPRFVEFVEAGVTGGDELLSVAQAYLAPMKDAGVDTLVLGCTHYPLLTGIISYVMGEGVALVSSAEETAQVVYRELRSRGIARDDGAGPPEHHFLTTGDPETFSPLAQRFLGATGAAIRAEALPVTASTGTIPRITAPVASGGAAPLRVGGPRP